MRPRISRSSPAAADGLLQSACAGTWGRTDLPTGNFVEIMNSISNRLMVLPDETIVYPGHGKVTMISDEKSIYEELRPKDF